MMQLTLSQLANWSDGELLQGVPSDVVQSVVTDSRKVEKGEVFLALKGDRFDAHDFVGSVSEAGAGALVVSELTNDTESFSGGIVRVKDSLKSLQRLAFHHRRNCDGIFVVGVTGSNGKTSTKDFLSAVLSARGKVNRTAGNLNNHIGLPLTILAGDGSEQFGVWEMGMNHPGEIEALAEIAAPDAAVITNIGRAHIEHMKTRDAIAGEKAELARAVSKEGYCVMPASDEYYHFVSDRVQCEMVSVGIDAGEVRAEKVESVDGGAMKFVLRSDASSAPEVVLPVKGLHMVSNALLAAAVGLRQGVSPELVAEKLTQVELSGGRLQERTVGGFRFLDDSYNANPDSMMAALETVVGAEAGGRRVAVFGFMGELGEHERDEHIKLGKAVSKSEIDALVTVGERAALINEGADGLKENHHFTNHETASEFLGGFLTPEDLVLVKGSRAAAMEKVIENLK